MLWIWVIIFRLSSDSVFYFLWLSMYFISSIEKYRDEKPNKINTFYTVLYESKNINFKNTSDPP